jgi:hypothetical protein
VKLTATAAEGLQCPACSAQAMTLFQKLCLGPARTRACRACGARVSVPWSSVKQTLPLLAGFVLASASFLIGGWLMRRNGADGKPHTALELVMLFAVPVAFLVAGFALGSLRGFAHWPNVPLELRGPARPKSGRGGHVNDPEAPR